MSLTDRERLFRLLVILASPGIVIVAFVWLCSAMILLALRGLRERFNP